jgi:hypothetical protein
MPANPNTATLPNSFLDLVQSGLAANLPAAGTFPFATNRTAFYYATDLGILYVWNPVTQSWAGQAPVGGAALTPVGTALTAKGGGTYALNAVAGSTLTLPAAIGSGAVIQAIVTGTTTSNAHKILTSPITDTLVGQAVGATAAGATLKFAANLANGFHSLQMPFAGTQPSGGLEGDEFTLTDIAAGKWSVLGHYTAGTTATTPFSVATT